MTRRYTDAQIRAMRERAASGANHMRLAEEFGCSQPLVGQIVTGAIYSQAGGPILARDVRRSRWVPGQQGGNRAGQPTTWTPEEDALLGTMTDRHVARVLGRATNAVATRRSRLGIPPAAPATSSGYTGAPRLRGRSRWERHQAGMTMTEIAAQDGVSTATVSASILLYAARRRQERESQ